MFQPLQSEPVADWSVKYSTRKKGLPLETIALFGRQILEVRSWYSLCAFSTEPLGWSVQFDVASNKKYQNTDCTKAMC